MKSQRNSPWGGKAIFRFFGYHLESPEKMGPCRPFQLFDAKKRGGFEGDLKWTGIRPVGARFRHFSAIKNEKARKKRGGSRGWLGGQHSPATANQAIDAQLGPTGANLSVKYKNWPRKMRNRSRSIAKSSPTPAPIGPHRPSPRLEYRSGVLKNYIISRGRDELGPVGLRF